MADKPLISFDYAIKYLLKDKGDYEIVEGFISALLNCKGYKPVKIVALLETESNKEDKKNKRSLVDLVVEDEEHHKYIIEIERSVKDSFAHKACFNASRLIVDHLSEKMDYTKIVKIFHISLLYFPVGNGAIYHGQTSIQNIETGESLDLHIKDRDTNEVQDALNVFPDYFFISVPLFNDRLEREIDDWLYVLKYDAIPIPFHSPYMQQVADKLNILKMTVAERESYAHFPMMHTSSPLLWRIPKLQSDTNTNRHFYIKRFFHNDNFKRELPDKKIIIRHGSYVDIEPWLKLRKELWPHCLESKHRLEMQEYIDTSDKKTVLLAELLQESNLKDIIGFLEISNKDHAEGCPEGPIGYLEGLYVTPIHRRSKIATLLMEDAEKWCKSKGCIYMASDTEIENHLSIKVHQRLNYKIANKLVHFVKYIS